MKETVHIKKFFRTGNFGELKEIQIGMNRNELINILGESNWVLKNRKSKYPTIYKYDKTEFYFEEGINGRLYGIQIKPTIDAAPKLNLNIEYDFLESDLNFDSIIYELKAEQIKYELFRFKYDDEDAPLRILTSGNVTLIFDDGYELEKAAKFEKYNEKIVS